MSFDLQSIKSSLRDRPKRIIITGTPKVGKSTLASQAPNPVFIPIRGEEGIDTIDVKAFPVANSIGDVLQAIGTLYSEESEYKTVVIDSMSTLEPIIWDEVCRINGKVDSIEKVGGGYQVGYTESLKQWREITEGLDALRNDKGIGSILITHVRVEKFNDPGADPYDRYTCDIHKKAVELLTRWADGILFMRKKVVVKKEDVGFGKKQARAIDTGGGAPFMYTQSRTSHPGGGRHPWEKLPYEMEPDWELMEKYLKGDE